MDAYENITVRKQHAKARSKSADSLNTTCDDIQVRSMMDLSTRCDRLEIYEIREKLCNTELQLETAHREIENLNIENRKLQDKIKLQDLQIRKLKLISSSPAGLTKGSKRRSMCKNSHSTFHDANSSFIDMNLDLHNSTMRDRNEQTYIHEKSSRTIDNAIDKVHNHHTLPRQKSFDKLNANSSKPTELTVSKYKKGSINQRNIYIFGGKQCTNLATQLIGHRQSVNTASESYKISSFMKPNACTEQIINTLKAYTFTDKDTLILSLGEHDHDPTKLMIEVSTILHSIQKNRVYILSVPNRYLNEKILNGKLKLMCKYFENCSFIDLHDGKQYDTVNIGRTCTRINMAIDQNDYDKKFLYPKLMKGKETDLTTHKKICKRDIPYYFKKQQNKALHNKNVGKQKNSSILDYFPILEKQETPPKNTILYYFKKKTIKNNDNLKEKLFRK